MLISPFELDDNNYCGNIPAKAVIMVTTYCIFVRVSIIASGNLNEFQNKLYSGAVQVRYKCCYFGPQ